MQTTKLIMNKPASVRFEKGMEVKCIRGTIWITADGRDIIIRAGETFGWCDKKCKAVFLSLNSNAEMILFPARSFFKKVSVFNNKSGFAGALAG